MEKNTEFIKSKEFHVVFKGYNPEEVDKFLDILAIEFERLVKKNRELQESLDRVNFESTEEESTDIKKIIQDALISAHKVADDIKSQAKKEAEEMVSRMKHEQDQALGNLKVKKISLEQSIDALHNRYDEFKNHVIKEIENINAFVTAPEPEYIFGSKEETGMENESGKSGDEDVPGQDHVESDEESSDFDSTRDGAIKQDQEEKSDMEILTDENKEREIPLEDSKDEEKSIEEEVKEEEVIEEEVKEENTDRGITGEKNFEPLEHQEHLNGDRRLADEKLKDAGNDGLKRERKKIDIANPDIIENFFRTNND